MTRRATVSLELDELRLIAAARAGDKDAFGQLLSRHQVAVFHAAYLHTGSAAQAQTVTMQAFVQGWRALHRKPATVPFTDWILSLVALDARADPRAGVEPPAPPDLSEAVLAELELDARPRRRARLAGMAAVAVIGAVVAVLALHGITERRAAPSANAAPLTPLAGAERFPLGRRIPLFEARHAAGFTTLMPPTPGGAYLGRDVPGGRVSVIAGRMLITEFRGAVLPYILSLIGPGTHAKLTWVNGRLGVYGSSINTQAPGDVLTWLQGPLTLRIEGAGTLEQALALARALR